jgi:predicted Na+-dependent transporter
MEGIIPFFGNVLLFVLVFAMSATVDIKCMRQQLQNHQALIVGCTAQFIILPLLGFIIVKLLSPILPYTIGIMVLVVTSSPGGSYSNWYVPPKY